MITFGPMHPLAAGRRRAPSGRILRRFARRPWSLSAIVVVGALAGALGTAPLDAQTVPSHTEDAAPIPRGMLRLRVTSAWTRYDQRFDSGGALSPLGAELSADPLGVAQLPALTSVEAGLRTLADDPNVRLSLGRLAVQSDARIAVTPISLEYGITRRFSVGVQIPIVQTRRTVGVRVNADSAALANMGFVPTATRGIAFAQNGAVADAFRHAADSLDVLLAQCPANPAASGCASVNADPADAAAARDQARGFAGAVGALGTSEQSTIVAPRDQGALATAIDARRLAINQRLQQYLGAGAGAQTSVFTATSDFSYIDLQGRNGVPGLLQSPLGGGLDSLHTTDRLGIGDVSVGAQFLVYDGFQHDTLPLRRLQARLAVGAAVRFATSQTDSSLNLVDIPMGDGAGIDLRSAVDLIVGHVGGTIAARYSKSFARTVTAPLYGDPDAAFPFPLFGERRRTAGDVMGLDVTPRILVNESLAFDGHYGLERVGAVTYDASTTAVPDLCIDCTTPPASFTTSGITRTAQRVGVGFRYSTVDAYARGHAPYPLEVSFTHLETISGDAGLPKSMRDQIQLRFYYRLFR